MQSRLRTLIFLALCLTVWLVEGACHPSCLTCAPETTGANDCLTCPTSRHFDASTGSEGTGSCVYFCPRGTFSDDDTCTACHPACESCFGPTASECWTCNIWSFLDDSTCASSCPSGTYANDKVCSPCPHACATCSSFDQCDSCDENRDMVNCECVVFGACEDGFSESGENCVESTCPPPKPELGTSFGDKVFGSADFIDDVMTIRAAGADIWGRVDEGVAVCQQRTGDASITIYVESWDATHQWAKVGAMFREDMTPGSKHAWVSVTGGNGFVVQYRASTGGFSTSINPRPEGTEPSWLRMTRVGDQLSGYLSADRETWTLVGEASVPMNPELYLCVAHTSHRIGTEATAVVKNITIE